MADDHSGKEHGRRDARVDDRSQRTSWPTHKLAVSESDGGVLRAEADVFMGQGDRFMLTLVRSEQKTLPRGGDSAP